VIARRPSCRTWRVAPQKNVYCVTQNFFSACLSNSWLAPLCAAPLRAQAWPGREHGSRDDRQLRRNPPDHLTYADTCAASVILTYQSA